MVVLFHAGLGCPGGYIGVDVFFVISGYLITSLIWKDLESGRFTFAMFWERRARRIVPALVAVTIVTLAAAWFFLLPVDFKNLGRASAAQAVFAANIHYWRDSGYFAGGAEVKPLLHTWSLAVEEQFYLIAPFLFWAIFRSVRLRNRIAICAILGTGSIVSLVLSVYGVKHYMSATFYLLPTRAWELALGSIIAFVPSALSWTMRKSLCEGISVAGLILILVPAFAYNAQTSFPGLAALLPCLGAAMVIWANGRTNDSQVPTVVGSLLAVRPVVFLGLISYSLYLWHWPILAFGRYHSITPLSLGHRAVLLGGGFLLAILSWRFVETPFRERKLAATRKSAFLLAGAGLAGVLFCGLLCMNRQGFPARFPAQAQAFANAKTDMSIHQLSIQDIREEKFVPLGATGLTRRPTVLVWGDSHAMAALPAFDNFLKERGLTGCAATHSSTPPVLDWFAYGNCGLDEGAVTYNQCILSYVHNRQICDVILVARWGFYIGSDVDKAGTFGPSLLATVRRLVAIGSRPWILLDVPNHFFDVPKGLALSAQSNTDIAPFCAKPMASNELDAVDPGLLSDIVAAGGAILDPKPRFLDQTGLHYIVQAHGTALYCDEHHLTSKGAKIMLLPLLRDSFTPTDGNTLAGPR